MATVTNNPLQLLQTHFEKRLEAGVNASSVNELVSYVGKFIQKGASWVQDDVKHEFSPQMVLLAARNAFLAKQDKAEAAQKGILGQGLSTLEKAFADKNLANVLKLSLETSAESYGVIQKSLVGIYGKVEHAVKGSPTLDEQQALIQQSINRAEIKAHNYETKMVDPKIFAQELSQLLEKNVSQLTKEGVAAMKGSIDSLGLAVNAFGLFEALPNSQNISGHLKYNQPSEGEALEAEFKQGKFGKIDLEDRKTVLNIFEDIVAAYESNINSGKMTEDKALALAHSQLLPKLGALNDKQIAYFKQLSSQYTELKAKQPSEWLSHLTSSLPGLVMPGIIGAVIACIFGFSGGLGAIGLAALSFLGGQPESRATSEPPQPRKIYDAVDDLSRASSVAMSL